jgi:DNA-binding PadR family transcriptional regulator
MTRRLAILAFLAERPRHGAEADPSLERLLAWTEKHAR